MNTSGPVTRSPWFRRPLQPHSAFRLFCFPFAGGNASLYRNWHDWLAPDIEVVAVELPGRGVHIGEPALDSMAPLVDRLLGAMRPHLDRPFAVFGHSLGALVAFELCRRLSADGGPQPEHLIASGMAAPHALADIAPIHHLPDAEFIDALRSLNGTPPEVLANEALLECHLGILRADFRLAETYRCGPIVPLRHPITVLGGIHDDGFRREDVEAWQQQTEAECVVRWLPGDHFFVRAHEHLIVTTLAGLLSVQVPTATRP
jgi:medium-chain acyl-[acyl-carrier-protein] hydrolase